MESSRRSGDISDTSSDNSASPMAPGLPVYHGDTVDHQRIRYPHCIVWTPIPCLTYVHDHHYPFSYMNFLVIVQTSSACRDLLLIQQLNKQQILVMRSLSALLPTFSPKFVASKCDTTATIYKQRNSNKIKNSENLRQKNK